METIAHKLEDSNLSPRRPICVNTVTDLVQEIVAAQLGSTGTYPQTGTLPATLDERLSNIESQVSLIQPISYHCLNRLHCSVIIRQNTCGCAVSLNTCGCAVSLNTCGCAVSLNTCGCAVSLNAWLLLESVK